MAYENPLKLHLSRELREKCERYVLDNVQKTVAAHARRNDDLFRWRDMLHGVPSTYSTAAWKNACQIEDGLIQEQRNQLLAPMLKPLTRFPLAMVNETTLAGKEKAALIETWLSQTMQGEGFAEAFALYVDSCVSYPAGVLCMEWKETERKRRAVRLWDGESYDNEGEPVLLLPSEASDETLEYESVPVLEADPAGRGREYRAVPLWDFYLSPPDASCLEKCNAVMECCRYTDGDLLNGMADYGFKRDAVDKCLAFMSTDAGSDERERYREIWGVEAGETGAKEDEFFIWYGYLPKLYDGEGRPELPKYLHNDLFCAVVHLASQTVLKLDFSPYMDYPYFMGNMLPSAGSPYGLGLCPMLEADQQEATHWRRTASNTADMIASPVTIMADGAWDLNKGQSIYPGAIFREEVAGSIRPYEMPTAPTVISTQMLDYTLNRAQRKAAAQGAGQVNQKQPLVAEMESVMALLDAKFDLFQYNIYRIVPEVSKRILEMELQFNPQFQGNLIVEGAEQQLSAQDIAEQYEFTIASLNQNASEEARAQRDMVIMRLQQEYFGYLMQTFNTPFAFTQAMKWQATRDALGHLSVRRAEQYIGTQPPPEGIQPPQPPIDPALLMQGLMGSLPQMAGGGAQGGAGRNGGQQSGMGAARNGAGMGGNSPAPVGGAVQ